MENVEQICTQLDETQLNTVLCQYPGTKAWGTNGIVYNSLRLHNFSLRGRRLEGKGKGVVALAPKTLFPFPFNIIAV